MTSSPYAKPEDARPRQGAVYRDIESVVSAAIVNDDTEVELTEWTFPYAVAMSQECDMLQDNDNRILLEQQSNSGSNECKGTGHDKLVPNILMCPCYPAASFREGSHLSQLKRNMEKYNSDRWAPIKRNQNPRYHYLAGWSLLQVAELVVDFKHFFTIPTEILRSKYGTDQYFIARLICPYREDLSQRFAAYLSRIGLPLEHHMVSEEA